MRKRGNGKRSCYLSIIVVMEVIKVTVANILGGGVILVRHVMKEKVRGGSIIMLHGKLEIEN